MNNPIAGTDSYSLIFSIRFEITKLTLLERVSSIIVIFRLNNARNQTGSFTKSYPINIQITALYTYINILFAFLQLYRINIRFNPCIYASIKNYIIGFIYTIDCYPKFSTITFLTHSECNAIASGLTYIECITYPFSSFHATQKTYTVFCFHIHSRSCFRILVISSMLTAHIIILSLYN